MTQEARAALSRGMMAMAQQAARQAWEASLVARSDPEKRSVGRMQYALARVLLDRARGGAKIWTARAARTPTPAPTPRCA